MTPGESGAPQSDVSDGDASGPAEPKHKKPRKGTGSSAGVSDASDVSDEEGSGGHTSRTGTAQPERGAAEAPLCAHCGLTIDADEARAEIAGKLYHSPDCSRWADHRPEVRGSDG